MEQLLCVQALSLNNGLELFMTCSCLFSSSINLVFFSSLIFAFTTVYDLQKKAEVHFLYLLLFRCWIKLIFVFVLWSFLPSILDHKNFILSHLIAISKQFSRFKRYSVGHKYKFYVVNMKNNYASHISHFKETVTFFNLNSFWTFPEI